MSENSEIAKMSTRADEGVTVLDPLEILEAHLKKCGTAKQAYDDMLKRQMSIALKAKVMAELKSGIHDVGPFKFSEELRKNDKSRMITLSLPPITSKNISETVDFYNKIIMSRKFLTKGTRWVYEQRGETKETYLSGLHIHILAPKTKKYPNEIARDLATPTGLAANFINVIEVNTVDCYGYLIDQNKKEEYKKRRIIFDNIMRTEFKIQNFYLK